jgi:hypothetical protein
MADNFAYEVTGYDVRERRTQTTHNYHKIGEKRGAIMTALDTL